MSHDYILKLKQRNFVLTSPLSRSEDEEEVINGKYLKCSGTSYFFTDKRLIEPGKNASIEFDFKIPDYIAEGKIGILYAQGDAEKLNNQEITDISKLNTQILMVAMIEIFGINLLAVIYSGEPGGALYVLPSNDGLFHHFFYEYSRDEKKYSLRFDGQEVNQGGFQSEINTGLGALIGGFNQEMMITIMPIEIDEFKICNGRGVLAAGYHFNEENESERILDFSGNKNHMTLVKEIRPPAVPIPAGYEAYWKFDNDADEVAIDETGNHNGTINGATLADGKYNKALQFDGIGNYVIAAVDGNNPNSFSLAMWIKPINTGGIAGIFQWTDILNSTIPFIYIQRTDSNTIMVDVDGNYRFTISNVPDDAWIFLGLKYDSSSGNWDMYVNDQHFGTYNGGKAYSSVSPNMYFGNGYGGYFSGIIDEPIYYKRALTSAEFLELYNRTVAPTPYAERIERDPVTIKPFYKNITITL